MVRHARKHPVRKFAVLAAALAAWLSGVTVPREASAHEFSGAHGTVVLDWELPNIHRVLASGYGDSFGTEAWARKGFPDAIDIDGRHCMDGSYFLFDVDDEFAFDIDETVTVEFLVDRTRTEGLILSYDRNVVAESIRDVEFAPSEDRWYRHSVTLERARFANRGESGSDFTVAAPDGTWFGDPEAEHRIVICDVQVSRSHDTAAATGVGEFALVVTDEDGEPTPVRVGLYDASDRMPLPSDDALTIHNYDDRAKQVFLRRTHGSVPPWPSENRYFFYVDGDYRAELPAGSYRLVLSKGPEYRRVVTDVEVRPDESTSAAFALERWIDMPASGWYSGDDHVHMTRTPEDNAGISAVMQAEDVHVTNLLQMGNPYDTHFSQYAFGREGRYREGYHSLVSGVEDPRTAVRGHTISLNIAEVFRPADRYLRYEQIFAEYRRQGGMSGYAHVAGRLFNVERGLAIDVPLGSVDFVEVLQDGVLETELWYEFLNLGFRLIPTAGSDFPYLSAPGGERNYVYVGDDDSLDAWYAALRNQRTFVTNGPILELTVNGQPMGSDVVVPPGETVTVRAAASLNPDIEALDRLEIVVHGETLASTTSLGEDNALALDADVDVADGVWIAARAFGADQAVAHSAPVYVTVGAGFEKWTEVPTLARRMIARLSEFEGVEADATLELEAWSVGENLADMLSGQRTAILERAAEARAVYARMLDRDEQGN